MKYIRFLAITVALVLTAACTQSDGHIGHLFGSWHLEEATAAGEPLELPAGSDTFFSFQNSVIMVTLSTDDYNASVSYGSFRHDGDILVLDFENHDNATAVGTGRYQAPVWLGFPSHGIFNLIVGRLDSGRMTLRWQNADGVDYTYNFTKTW